MRQRMANSGYRNRAMARALRLSQVRLGDRWDQSATCNIIDIAEGNWGGACCTLMAEGCKSATFWIRRDPKSSDPGACEG